MDSHRRQLLEDFANQLRINSIKATNASNSGHPTSCASAAEIVSVLFFDTMRYTIEEPLSPASDRFLLSKGHAAPVLYAAWAQAGLFSESELLNFRKIDSDLEGHPTPKLKFVDIATGSLGQGLSCAAGMAYTGKYFDKASYRVYCLIGDGESAEGAIWEALSFSSHYKLDNLMAIFDINRLGQSEPTALQHDMEVYRKRLDAFGWNTYITDGHSVEDLATTFHKASMVKGKPSCILAKTFKGKGFLEIENHVSWHGKPIGTKAEAIIAHLESLIQSSEKPSPKAPDHVVQKVNISNIKLASAPAYELGEKLTTRAAYGTALAKLGHTNSRIIALDGDTKDSTYSKTFEDAHPDRFIECFIAEQNLVGVAIGCATRDRTVPFVSIFAAFFSRAYDQIRMGAISQTNVNFVGSHSGISIGADGACEMALEDLAMFRAIPGSTVFYPSDAVSCERAVELAANQKGICYIRTTRPTTATVYPNDEVFKIGEGKIVRQSPQDRVTVIAAGITLHEAIEAADTLAISGINIRVIDPFTIKPLDSTIVVSNAKQTGGKIITVEDHYPEGGLGDAVYSVVGEEENIVVKRMAVTSIPRSGQPKELLHMFGISASCITQAVKLMLNCPVTTEKQIL